MPKKLKQPKHSEPVQEQKLPKAAIDPGKVSRQPRWAFRRLDIDGPWCWSKMDSQDLKEVLERLKALESMTWQAITQGTGSHRAQVSKLCSKAQKRLQDVQLDDFEELYSVRVSGKKRLWGVHDGDVFLLLWWDPEHEVYPSHKKHT